MRVKSAVLRRGQVGLCDDEVALGLDEGALGLLFGGLELRPLRGDAAAGQRIQLGLGALDRRLGLVDRALRLRLLGRAAAPLEQVELPR